MKPSLERLGGFIFELETDNEQHLNIEKVGLNYVFLRILFKKNAISTWIIFSIYVIYVSIR